MKTILTPLKIFAITTLFIGILFSCKKEEAQAVNSTAESIDETVNKTKETSLDFEKGDPKIIPVLEAYLETYVFGVTEWKHKDIYNLKDFDLILSLKGEDGQSVAAYMVLPPNSNYKGDTSDVVETKNKPTDGTFAIRMNDQDFLEKAISSLKQGSFGSYQDRYLIIHEDETDFEYNRITGSIDFIIHEGFHLFPQYRDFTLKSGNFGQYRFNMPKHYPHDLESFTLIYAGHKIAEMVAHTTDRKELLEYAKMFYTILNRLIANDTSEEEFVKNWFLNIQWLEGLTSYITYNAIKERSFYETDIAKIPYQVFSSLIENVIENKRTGITYSDQDGIHIVEYPYSDIIDTSAYLMGVWLYGTLDLLDYDVFEPSKKGISIDVIYKNYFAQNNIIVDQNAVLESIKTELPSINWNDTEEIVKDYINLWAEDSEKKSSYHSVSTNPILLHQWCQSKNIQIN